MSTHTPSLFFLSSLRLAFAKYSLAFSGSNKSVLFAIAFNARTDGLIVDSL
jgi:hypothetical protein